MLDLPTVPALDTIIPQLETEKSFSERILQIVAQQSGFESFDIHAQQPSTMEGIVARNTLGYEVNEFYKNVFKYVRKNHVKTSEHWTRNWKRANLNWEKNVEIDK